jgi:replicative DNA helicase
MAEREGRPVAEKQLPNNVELERAVLATLLLGSHSTAIHKVRQHLSHPLAFYARNHRIIYLACLDLDDDSQHIDATAVADWLGRLDFRVALDRLRRQQQVLDAQSDGGFSREAYRRLHRLRDEDFTNEHGQSALAAIGDFAALAEIADAFAPVTALERNSQLTWDLFLKRRFIDRLSSLADEAYMTTASFGDLVDQGSQALLDLGGMDSATGIKPVAKVVDDTIDRIGEAMNTGDVGIVTGWEDVDRMLMSLRPGGLYIIAARPGVGKTSFALNLVEHVTSRQDKGVLFFSLEVDATDLVKKLISAYARIGFSKLEMGDLDDAEMAAIHDAAQQLRSWPLDLMDLSDLTVLQLRSHVKRLLLERQGQLGLIVIDYLQLLSSSRANMSEYEKVSEISRTLKIIAKDCKVPIIALSQLSREGEKGKERSEPRLAHLRGSGSIEQDADAVVFLHRVDESDESSERRMKVIVAKNRFGPTDSVPMMFYASRQRFVQMQQDETPDNFEREAVETIMRDSQGDDEDLFG